ncbi:element excision factor XisH family protein [Tychonema sp. LEGE 07203]|uniref:element excision factor XisH family protein n=1 Tax=Tychonema sp. LEGE 07203 TaxID=1828671 RepID=UPI00187F2907|nr:hypothetical protein [Tychonema sp. LEGE 07203]
MYHYYNVRTALEKDGWIITDDPFPLRLGLRGVLVDLYHFSDLCAMDEVLAPPKASGGLGGVISSATLFHWY